MSPNDLIRILELEKLVIQKDKKIEKLEVDNASARKLINQQEAVHIM